MTDRHCSCGRELVCVTCEYGRRVRLPISGARVRGLQELLQACCARSYGR